MLFKGKQKRPESSGPLCLIEIFNFYFFEAFAFSLNHSSVNDDGRSIGKP